MQTQWIRVPRWLKGSRGNREPDTTNVNLAHFERQNCDLAPAGPAILLLDQIEERAISVYAEHGLPQRQGLYMKSQRAKHWKFLAATLSPEERWDLMLTHPLKDGWRFASLEELGRQHPGASPRLIQAADILASCKHFRPRLKHALADANEDFERAVYLGRNWHDVTLSSVPGTVRLRFQPMQNDAESAGATTKRRSVKR